jgi:hypothetical protein
LGGDRIGRIEKILKNMYHAETAESARLRLSYGVAGREKSKDRIYRIDWILEG